MEEYASIVLDLTARQARDLLPIGKALPGLPKLEATLAAGHLDWTTARELVRVLVPETEAAWIERAKSVPSRMLELQVASRHKGQLPPIAAEMGCDAEIVDLRPGLTAGHVTRTIPPAVRRRVLGRAKGRCEVPQCRNKLHLDVHHIHPRVLGGTHDPAQLVCICHGHHRAVHRGYLAVERRSDGTVEVRRAGPGDGLR